MSKKVASFVFFLSGILYFFALSFFNLSVLSFSYWIALTTVFVIQLLFLRRRIFSKAKHSPYSFLGYFFLTLSPSLIWLFIGYMAARNFSVL